MNVPLCPVRVVLRLTVVLSILTGGIAAEEVPYRPPEVRVPEGFAAELAAAPPLVKHPLMAGFDERGRLFVAESAGRNLKRAALEKELPNFVRMLEDTDGDGRFDKSTIFADKMTLPQGALWYRGALYVCAPPGLWRLEDTDDDGVADRREMIVGRFGYTGNAASIHGPFLGPTGRIYWCDGRHGHEFRDRKGNVTSQGKAARIFSCLPDGSDVQTHCGGGMDNPVEIDFLPTGEMLGTVNLFYRQRGDCLVHWVRGGVYPRYDQPDCLAEFPSTGEPLTEVHNYGHVAVSGCMRYRSGKHGFGKRYTNNFFVTQFNTHKVVRTVLTRYGGTFAAKTQDFLDSPSTDFHPTDVLEDADGSLLVIDTGGWFRIGCPTSQIAKPNIHGAIWRIRKKDGHRLEDPRGLKIDWQTDALDELLGDPRFAVRERAIDQCALRYRKHAQAREFAQRIHEERRDERVRRNAVWVLRRLQNEVADTEGLERLIQARAARDPAESVRLAAAAGGFPRRAEEIKGELSGAERRAIATAIGSRDRHQSHESLCALLREHGPVDRVTEHAIIFALIHTESPDLLVDALSTEEDPVVQRALLVALDQMPSGGLRRELVVPLVASDDFALRTTALAIVASHPEWAKGVDRLIAGQLERSSPAERELDTLRALLGAFVDEPAVQDRVGEALGHSQIDPRIARTVLGAMGGMRNRPWPKSWHAGVDRALDSELADMQLAAVTAIVNAEEASFADQLARLAGDNSASVGVRVAAMSGLAKFGRTLSGAGVSLLLNQLDADDALARLQAARTLGSANLDEEQLRQVAAAIPEVGAMELGPLLSAFAQANSRQTGMALLAGLQASLAKKSIAPGRLHEMFHKYPPEVKQSAAEMLKSATVDSREQEERLRALLAAADGGDAKRGREIFHGRHAACAACHRVGSEGGGIGPDLSTIATRRDRRDLLEAIVFPSASLARGFESYSVATSAGKVHTGVIVHQSAEELQLRTADQNEVRLPRGRIDDIQPSPISIMPQGLDRMLGDRALRDLVAYLESLR